MRHKEAVTEVQPVGNEGLTAHRTGRLLFGVNVRDGHAGDRNVQWNDRVNRLSKGQLNWPAHLTSGIVACGKDRPECADIIKMIAHPLTASVLPGRIAFLHFYILALFVAPRTLRAFC